MGLARLCEGVSPILLVETVGLVLGRQRIVTANLSDQAFEGLPAVMDQRISMLHQGPKEVIVALHQLRIRLRRSDEIVAVQGFACHARGGVSIGMGRPVGTVQTTRRMIHRWGQ